MNLNFTGIAEIEELGISIGTLLKQIEKQENQIAQISFDRGRVKMAEQVAHSIKGLIATVQLKTTSLKGLSDKEKRELNEIVGSLRDVSGYLLRQGNSIESGYALEKREPTHILPVLHSVTLAKENQYRKSDASIKIENKEMLFGSFISMETGTFQAIMANLIDNSVEAGATKISISSQRHGEILNLTISDNGAGIPLDILPRLMAEGATFGKANGNGIGLFHAKESLTAIGGEIKIGSSSQAGAVVDISMPLVEAPCGFVTSLEIPAGATFVMVDDDLTIHEAMKLKIRNSNFPFAKVVHLYSAPEFETWIDKNGTGELGERFYIFDFDLKDPEKNGLDLIEKHGLAFESVLVSGMTDKPEVKEKILQLGLRWAPKDFLANLRIFSMGGQPETASFLGVV